MKSLLITGGRGLIGQSIVAAAEDSESFSRIVTLGRSNPPGLKDSEIVHHEIGSILDEQTIQRMLETHETTHLVHAAGARTKECTDDPGMAYQSNVLGTDVVFRMASQSPSLEKAVFLSTAAVYGNLNLESFAEDSPIAPQSNYAISKAAAEMAVARHLPESIIVRPGFVVGINQSKLYQFTQEVLTNERILLRFAEWFFVHSEFDVGRAVVRLLLSDMVGKYHLPGHSLHLEEFGKLLEALAEDKSFSPRIDLQKDASMSVPGNLGFDRFAREFPDFEFADPKTIFQSILPS